METGTTAKASFSLPSIIAIIAAIASFATGAFWGLILAVIAMVCGVIGVGLSLSPSVRGGVVSTLSLLAGGAGILVAAFKALAALL